MFEADIATGTDGKSSEHIGNTMVLVKTGDAFLSNDVLSRLLTNKLKGHNLEDITVTNDKGLVPSVITAGITPNAEPLRRSEKKIPLRRLSKQRF